MTPSGIEPATFLIVAQYLNQLRAPFLYTLFAVILSVSTQYTYCIIVIYVLLLLYVYMFLFLPEVHNHLLIEKLYL